VLGLLVPQLGELGIGAALAARPALIPERIVFGLSVPDKVKLHWM
jgi:hypothetical protein